MGGILMLKVNVRKNWGDFKLKVCFSQRKGELVAVLGPSGCGKSTLLNLIAGVVSPDGGEIQFNGDFFYRQGKVNVPVHKRRIGYIQQNSNLFPHLTVEQNILYGVKDKTNKSKINKISKFMGIDYLLNKKPGKISGGQQQRVALARALMINPKILLLDEPFSALDNIKKIKLRELLLKIKAEFQIPIIFVTHDLNEAYTLGDRVAVMDEGVFLQFGLREEVFRYPINSKVARFVGMTNIIPGKVVSITPEGAIVNASGIMLKTPGYFNISGRNVTLAIRPGDIRLVKHDIAEGNQRKENVFSCYIIGKKYGIENCKLTLQLLKNGLTLEMLLPNYVVKKHNIEVGQKIRVSLKKNCITVLGTYRNSTAVIEGVASL